MEGKTTFRLLFVEDNPGDAVLLAEQLTNELAYSFELTCASSLAEASKLLQQTRLDAVVLDLNLPDSSGLDTLRRLQLVRSDIPIVVLSGLARNDIRQQALDAGAQDFIGKGEPSSQLFARSILHALEHYHVQQQQRQLQRIFAANPDAIIVVDAAGVVRFVNEAALTLFGKRRADFVGELLGFSVPEGYISEIEVLRHGEFRTAEMHVATIEWDNAPAFLASIRDVTVQKKLAERLRQSQKIEAIGQLASGIAHDFNNILAAISGNLQLARLDLPPQHPVQESLAEIDSAVARATAIVRQILTFGRNQGTTRKVIELQPVIEESLRFLGVTLPANIEITSRFDAALPAVSADVTQIQQVLMNLCTNAAHAMQGHGGQLDVQLTVVTLAAEEATLSLGLQAGRYLRLSVRDTGCGMDSKTCERIFEPFFTTKPAGVGSGLGLSLVHGIVRSHDGAMTVYSELGKGTIFHLYFPTANAKPGITELQPEPQQPRKYGRILFVDDEKPLVTLAERMLQRLGYEVTGFSQPADALARFNKTPGAFDVVVTDMSMPGMDGPELVQFIRRIRPDIPIVMSTGYIRPKDQQLSEELGIREILLKPIAIEKLIEILDSVL